MRKNKPAIPTAVRPTHVQKEDAYHVRMLVSEAARLSSELAQVKAAQAALGAVLNEKYGMTDADTFDFTTRAITRA